MRAWVPATLFLAIATAGCGATYTYRPEVNANAVVDRRVAAYYRVPSEAPKGDVRIASFGIAELEAADASRISSMHIRMVVANNDTRPWTVDTREQIGVIEGSGQSPPAHVTVSQGAPPVLEIPPSGKLTLDLYYPLPPEAQEAERLPQYDVIWRVHTGTGAVVSERTPFERLRVEAVATGPYDPRYPGGYGWGYPGYGFRDPYGYGGTYGRSGFMGPPGSMGGPPMGGPAMGGPAMGPPPRTMARPTVNP